MTEDRQPAVLSWDDARADLALAGGKGASLARLARAGFPVPDGFHVTTAAYRAFVAEHELAAPIAAALATADAETAVARELGIPAVVGYGVATSRLTTGDRVLVDGGAGTVTVLT